MPQIDKQLTEKFLSQTNPILNPQSLKKLLPAYKAFTPQQKYFGLWLTSESRVRIKAKMNSQKKILLLISGVAAGGKDAIRKKIEELNPNFLFKAITATSRPSRDDEQHGIDYYFYSKTKFKAAVSKNKFIESVQQGNRFYGIPFASLDDALSRKEPVVCSHVEMSAWPKLETYIKKNFSNKQKPFILKIFVMPEILYSQYRQWLSDKRQDIQARLERTAWELSVAPTKSDIIITNKITEKSSALKWQAQALTNQILLLLRNDVVKNFKSFPTPFVIFVLFSLCFIKSITNSINFLEIFLT